MKKTHWKSLTDAEFLGAWSLEENENRVLKIKHVERKEITGPGGRKDDCTVATFEEGLPMVINATNAKAISLVANSSYIEDWVGHSISVHMEMVKFKGDLVEGLRVDTVAPESAPVKESKPASKVVLKKDTENWGKVVTYVENNKSKPFEDVFATLQKKYKITQSLKTELEKI
jgi:hypothetical protein